MRPKAVPLPHSIPYHSPFWAGRDRVVMEHVEGRRVAYLRPRRPKSPPARLLKAAVALVHRKPEAALAAVDRLRRAGLSPDAIKAKLRGRFAGHKVKKVLGRRPR